VGEVGWHPLGAVGGAMKNGRFRPDEEVTIYLQMHRDGSVWGGVTDSPEEARSEAWANKLDQYDDPPPDLDQAHWLSETSTVMLRGRWSCLHDIVTALDYDGPSVGEDGAPR
jgi:hypothetical protein